MIPENDPERVAIDIQMRVRNTSPFIRSFYRDLRDAGLPRHECNFLVGGVVLAHQGRHGDVTWEEL